MDDNKRPSRRKLLSIHEEKIVREINYEEQEASPFLSKLLELEILHKKGNSRSPQRVTISVKPRVPVIKTLFNAEKDRLTSVKNQNNLPTVHEIGDHLSPKKLSREDVNLTVSVSFSPNRQGRKSKRVSLDSSSEGDVIECPPSRSRDSNNCVCQTQTSNTNNAPGTLERCYVQNQLNMNPLKPNDKLNVQSPQKIDKATLIITKPASEDSLKRSSSAIDQLNKRLEELERKVLRQKTIIYPIALNSNHSLEIEESASETMKSTSMTDRPGCSYIEQYSHIPQTSAFQRHTHQTSPLSLNIGSTSRNHDRRNSEQYGRDFTAYDGITSRGKRQCASVPCKRNEVPNVTQDRGKHVRHKLNPVHDYRLMNTVHYLAQGEFAPRDDGIKLTQSREAVLSDIIWEDVCRTHWPNARLSRRMAQYDRRNTRSELQRLIDGLLRDRVSHVERKRRRHYKVVRLNHGQTTCKAVGKTGDVIVASHKKPDNRDVVGSNRDAPGRVMTGSQYEEQSSRRHRRSRERFSQEALPTRNYRQEDSPPGTSHAAAQVYEEVACCHRSGNQSRKCQNSAVEYVNGSYESGSSNEPTCRHHNKARLLVKKDSRRMYHQEFPKMEHYILLPTLVVRSPSNLKRQRKFNELYQRIQHVKDKDSYINSKERRYIGMNINILSDNEDNDKKNR